MNKSHFSALSVAFLTTLLAILLIPTNIALAQDVSDFSLGAGGSDVPVASIIIVPDETPPPQDFSLIGQNGGFSVPIPVPPDANPPATPIEITVLNGSGSSASTSSVAQFINLNNSVPTANNAEFTLLRDGSISSILSGSDADNDTIKFLTTTLPANGTVDLNNTTGQFYYFPNNSFVGNDLFQFVADDGQLTSQEATVSVMVNMPVYLEGLEENLAADFDPPYNPESLENPTNYLAAKYEETSVTFRPLVDEERVDEIRIMSSLDDVEQVVTSGAEATFNLRPGTNTYFYFTLRSQGEVLGYQNVSIYREGPPLASIRVQGFELSPAFTSQNRYYSVSNIPFETQNVSLFVESTDPIVSFIRITDDGDESFSVTRGSENLAEPFVLPIPSFEGRFFTIDALDEDENFLGSYGITLSKDGKILTGITENLAANLNQDFQPAQRWYSLNAAFEEAEVSVGINTDDPAITGFRVVRDGKGFEEAVETIGADQLFTVPLNFGWNNYLNVLLYSGDEHVGSYYLNVYREGPPLASLRVDGFEISPAFDSQNHYYSVNDIPFETQEMSLFVEAGHPAIATIRVTNDGNFDVTRSSDDLAAPFVLPIPAFKKGNYYVIETLDADGMFMGRYEISFHKQEKILTNITENLAGNLQPEFNPAHRWYSLNAAFEEAEISIGIDAGDPAITGFRVVRDGKGGNEDEVNIIGPDELSTMPLNFGWNNYFSILLYSGNEHVGSYYLDVYREGPPLASLRVDGFELSPQFDPKTRYYHVGNVPFELETVSLLIESTHPLIAAIQIKNLDGSFQITRGSDTLAEPFVLPIPSFSGHYFVIDTLDASGSSLGKYDVSLSKKEKTVTSITENLAAQLDPVFDPAVRDYRLDAAFEESEVALGITTDDPVITGFRVTNDGKGLGGADPDILAPDKTFTVPLNFGYNYFVMALYTGDEHAGAYFFTIYREGHTLSSLTENIASDLLPAWKSETTPPVPGFKSEAREYYLLMLPNEDAVTFSLKPGTLPETGRVHVYSDPQNTDQYIQPNGSIEIPAPNNGESNSGVGYASVNFDLFLNEDPESYVGRYTVYIEKFAATLSGIAEDDPEGDLIPAFQPSTVEYTLRTALETQAVRLTPATQNTTVKSIQTYVYSEGFDQSDEKTIAPGEVLEAKLRGLRTYVQMDLRGADNIHLGSYRVTIEKVPSSVSTLQALAEDTPADISPSFATDITGYALNVENTVTQIHLSPTATSAKSTVRINDADVAAGTFPLSVGGNTFNISVTAQDTKNVTTYTLTVNRAAERSAGGGGGQVSQPRTEAPPRPTVLGARTQLYPDGTVMKVKGSKSKFYLMKEGQKVYLTPLEYKTKYSKARVVEVKKNVLNQVPTMKKAKKHVSILKKKLP